MSETGQNKPGRKPRAVAALAILFGLFLNVAGPSNAHMAGEARAALGNGEAVRNGSALRVAARNGDDATDREGLPAVLPPEPRIVTSLLSIRPGAAFTGAAASVPPAEPALHYRARAPPAA
jgi:hypothetical protein